MTGEASDPRYHNPSAEDRERGAHETAVRFFGTEVFRYVAPLVTLLVSLLTALPVCAMAGTPKHEDPVVIDLQLTQLRLHEHLAVLTRAIGERSVRKPRNLLKTAAYIQAFCESIQVPVCRESYTHGDLTVHNIVARIQASQGSSGHFLLGAHYDSVAGTVGADDNASATAVQLETARELKAMADRGELRADVSFVAFALEEPPAYGTASMGSRVYASKARREKMVIDGMICLEMVGYTCRQPGCQRYPFPLQFLGYPRQGTFIGIVGNFASRLFARSLQKSFTRNPQLPVVSISVPFNGWVVPAVRLSDHASFWDEGYRAVMVTDSAFYRNPHYHRPSDTMDTLDLAFMSELVESLVRFFCAPVRSETR